jgi:hypothetical protein
MKLKNIRESQWSQSQICWKDGQIDNFSYNEQEKKEKTQSVKYQKWKRTLLSTLQKYKGF